MRLGLRVSLRNNPLDTEFPAFAIVIRNVTGLVDPTTGLGLVRTLVMMRLELPATVADAPVEPAGMKLLLTGHTWLYDIVAEFKICETELFLTLPAIVMVPDHPNPTCCAPVNHRLI